MLAIDRPLSEIYSCRYEDTGGWGMSGAEKKQLTIQGKTTYVQMAGCLYCIHMPVIDRS